MLSELQRQTLLQKTRNNWSQADISSFLTQECGLGFRDAHTERAWAVKIIQDEKTKQAEEDAKRDPLEEARLKEEREKEAARRAEEDLRQHLAQRNPAFPYHQENHPEKECSTCGDPTFYCECTCKGGSYIPF